MREPTCERIGCAMPVVYIVYGPTNGDIHVGVCAQHLDWANQLWEPAQPAATVTYPKRNRFPSLLLLGWGQMREWTE